MDLEEILEAAFTRVFSKYGEKKENYSEEDKDLWLQRLNGMEEILLYVKISDKDWFLNRTRKPKSQMSDSAYRTSKHRFKKEMLSKIGEDIFDNISNSTSADEVKRIIELFRTRSGFRNIKRAFLMDLYNESISECGDAELTSDQKFERIINVRDKTNSSYGKRDSLKLNFIESFRVFDDPCFSYTKQAANLFADREFNFDELFVAIKIDLDSFNKNR
ncbi:hypothetical protein [Salipaludibacillus sp. CF4.18]|uniref:hypothetical protein n=1 Tax=Salipaludibacillus sp. CF4.18 TaxID=3373081 RepID=UPI003EE7C357